MRASTTDSLKYALKQRTYRKWQTARTTVIINKLENKQRRARGAICASIPACCLVIFYWEEKPSKTEIRKGEAYLLVEFHESGLELLIQASTLMIRVLHLGMTLWRLSLFGTESFVARSSGHSVKRNINVRTVANRIKFDVRDLLVARDSGVVCGDIARQFGEVWSHLFWNIPVVCGVITLTE